MKLNGGLDGILHRQSLARWDRVGAGLSACDPVSLRAIRQEAIDLRHRLDRVVADTECRLVAETPEGRDLIAPSDSDWAWRPPVFCTRLLVPGQAGVTNGALMGDALKIFHDCTHSEISVRQRAGRGQAGAAPQVIDLDVMGFDGSFLSLVVDLPPEAIRGLSMSHIVQIDLMVEYERPLELFARLNIKHGPNVEQVVRELDLREPRVTAEIDLAYTDIVEAQIDRAWLDIIVGQPRMNRLSIRDFVLSRRLRAEM